MAVSSNGLIPLLRYASSKGFDNSYLCLFYEIHVFKDQKTLANRILIAEKISDSCKTIKDLPSKIRRGVSEKKLQLWASISSEDYFDDLEEYCMREIINGPFAQFKKEPFFKEWKTEVGGELFDSVEL
eukprot:TRINITY_DN10681_c0_g1_i1.p1 TRINITY_DN10681_c0_g1~~TRINITY_DN10681_c0_g1_i1.p1  ORF type:complete len:128 (+),score=41.51 TRINITY_DN10681_c0_g1_i1:225-608(+)